jgi:hypothetical protein
VKVATVLALALGGALAVTVTTVAIVEGPAGFAELQTSFRAELDSFLFDHWAGYRDRAARKAFASGVEEAQADLLQGRNRILVYGGPPSSADEFVYRAFLDLGYELESVASCMVEFEVKHHADGYNSVAIPRFEEQFGEGSYGATWDLARAAARRSDI